MFKQDPVLSNKYSKSSSYQTRTCYNLYKVSSSFYYLFVLLKTSCTLTTGHLLLSCKHAPCSSSSRSHMVQELNTITTIWISRLSETTKGLKPKFKIDAIYY